MSGIRGLRTVLMASTKFGFERLLSMGLLDYSLHHYMLLDNEFSIITESRHFQMLQYHYWEYRFQVVCGE